MSYGADLEESVDGAVEEGVPHVDGELHLGRPRREPRARHPSFLPSTTLSADLSRS
jgi:hypothetical protein